ncbi:endonuclease [Acrasis kona]|uniref:Endonuclease n=1 Tax=Acrasis kona TaxID=1008807 RepID=A0AAW2ZJA4_9EUKA
MANIITLSVVALCLCAMVHCWGKDGHIITGNLAQEYLSDKAQEMVQDILSKYEGPDGARFKQLGPLAPYADVLRESYPWAVTYHFINVEKDQKGFVPKINCPNLHCLFGAINNYTKIMLDKDSSDFSKGTALMFLTHFFGDLHQPLHVAHKSDKGGNDIKLKLNEDWFTRYKSSNLHHIWDSDMLYQFQRVEEKPNTTHVVDYIKNNLVNKQALDKYGKVDDLIAVSDESLNLSLKVAYKRALDLDLENFPISYYDSVIPTVLNQVMAGGLRLSAWLNYIADEANAGAENHNCVICNVLGRMMSRLNVL